MQERTLARRYAKGLFAAAREEQVLDRVEQELRVLTPILSAPREMRLMNSPCINSDEKRRMIEKALGAGCSTAIMNLLVTLAERRRMKAFPELARAFRGLLDAHRGIVRVKARLAAQTTEAALAGMKAKLASTLGKDVEVEPEVDPSLIGGATIVMNDTILDGSVKGALERLRERMRQ
jgi:F-type H+-transporting ATPase subunit delta